MKCKCRSSPKFEMGHGSSPVFSWIDFVLRREFAGICEIQAKKKKPTPASSKTEEKQKNNFDQVCKPFFFFYFLFLLSLFPPVSFLINKNTQTHFSFKQDKNEEEAIKDTG